MSKMKSSSKKAGHQPAFLKYQKESKEKNSEWIGLSGRSSLRPDKIEEVYDNEKTVRYF